MKSKLPNLLPLEAYNTHLTFSRHFAVETVVWTVVFSLDQVWLEHPPGVVSTFFRAIFFALSFTAVERSTAVSRWKNSFYRSDEGRLVEPPPSDALYQLANDQGILFFSAAEIRFVPHKRLGSNRPWKKPIVVEFLPLDSITARVLGSSSQNWLGWWPQIEITANNARLVVRVPDADEAVAQIGRAVETLSAAAR